MSTASEPHYNVRRTRNGVANEVVGYYSQRHTIASYETGVYEFLHMIPKGKVATYGQVAEYLGNPHLARIVGNILHRNPDGDLNPCYKIVNSKGELSGSFAFGGETEQASRLRTDGIIVENNKVDLAKYQYHPN